jgi:hypothetical protein
MNLRSIFSCDQTRTRTNTNPNGAEANAAQDYQITRFEDENDLKTKTETTYNCQTRRAINNECSQFFARKSLGL